VTAARQYAQPMDAAQALADLTEISSEVVHVVIVGGDGSLLATTVGDQQRAERLVAAISRLLEEAERLARTRGLGELSQLEASTLEGSVFAARSGGRLIAATTRPDPTVGLVFYDLKHCLGSIEETPAAKPKRAAAAKAEGAPRRARKAGPSA
jgi:predicted regulator of Ras-like GTPase activity (Roadblock/LC7/MglB family)